MRQKSTVRASSRRAADGVVFGWAIRGSFRWGVGWLPFYRQSTQQTSRERVVLRPMSPRVLAALLLTKKNASRAKEAADVLAGPEPPDRAVPRTPRAAGAGGPRRPPRQAAAGGSPGAENHER